MSSLGHKELGDTRERPEQRRLPEGVRLHDPHRGQHHEQIHHLVGKEMRGVDSPVTHEHPVEHGRGQRTDRERAELAVAHEGVEEMRDAVQSMLASAHSLVSLHMEHRVDDIWDHLPIFSNIRSHRLATKEAEVIDAMKAQMKDLEATVAKYMPDLDLRPLQEMIYGLSAPGGVSKWLTSFVPGLRTLIRSFTPGRGEEIRRMLNTFDEELRKARRQLRRAA